MATVRYTNIERQMIAEKRGGVRRTVVPDALGSTIALIDPSGAIDQAAYWPFGALSNSFPAGGPRFQFVGTFGYASISDRLIYVRARVFDARCARWITLDPVHLNRDATSRYAYTANNPVSRRDPTGLFVIVIVLVGVVLVLGGCAPKRPRPKRPPPKNPPVGCGGLPTGCVQMCLSILQNQGPSKNDVLECCMNMKNLPPGTPEPSLPLLPTFPAADLLCADKVCEQLRKKGLDCGD